MSKKSTAKISILLVSILSCLVLFSCADPNNNSNADKTPSKEELWSSMKGNWIYESSDDIHHLYSTHHARIYITDECIKYIEYNEQEAQVEPRWLYKNILTIKELKERIDDTELKYDINQLLKKYDFNDSDLGFYKSPYNNQVKVHINFYKIINNKLYVIDFTQMGGHYYYRNTYILDTSSSGNNSEDNNSETSITASDLIGSYAISEANDSTFTFDSNGAWTYKYNSSTTEGAWSVSDGELTITYSLGGYSSTAVFTVSTSGDTYTLAGKSDDYTTIISSAFKITDQEALENGKVTLVKQ